MVYRWMGIPERLIKVLQTIMGKWKTRLEIFESGTKMTSRVLDINTGFLQGDSLAATGFCMTEVPVGELIASCKGFELGRDVYGNGIRCTHSLIIDDLKVYASS